MIPVVIHQIPDEKEIEKQTEFNVVLEEVAANKKISVLKLVREIKGLGLKEAFMFC